MSARIFMVAGETSGDLHGSRLAAELLRARPDLELTGIGGPRMSAAGVKLLRENLDLGVVGISEVWAHRRAIRDAYRVAREALVRRAVELTVLIDYPDFNLRVARVSRAAGIPVVYYISPQVWAWRRSRVRLIRRVVDRMIVILPFEQAIYRAAGVPCDFVGHPLLDDLVEPKASTLVDPQASNREDGIERSEVAAKFGLDPQRPIIGLLPGSRNEEVRRLLPSMARAMELLHRELPGVQPVVAAAPSLAPGTIDSVVRGAAIKVTVVEGATQRVLGISDAAVVASGTATLEAALLGVPSVIVYRVSRLTYLLGRLLVRTPDIGLVNLVAGKRILPELLQDEVTPDRIAESLLPMLREPAVRRGVQRELSRVRALLGSPGAAARAAERVLSSLPVAHAARSGRAEGEQYGRAEGEQYGMTPP